MNSSITPGVVAGKAGEISVAGDVRRRPGPRPVPVGRLARGQTRQAQVPRPGVAPRTRDSYALTLTLPDRRRHAEATEQRRVDVREDVGDEPGARLDELDRARV